VTPAPPLPPPATPEARRLVADLLARCVRVDASDVHLAPGQHPHFRVGGDLAPAEDLARLDAAAVEACDAVLFEWSGTHGWTATGSQDGALTDAAGSRFRFNVYRRLGGCAIALRRLEERFRTLQELGLPERLYKLCDLPDGIVLLAGPTGAGKSTTLAALIDRVNEHRRTHVITIEDPIEYIHASKKSLVEQRQVGLDTSSFNDALVASLRQDPDVLLVGEIRDLDTIRTAIRAAETGHLVFTTVHAGDCVGTVERLVAVFPADEQSGVRQQLSLVLRAVVAQILLPADGAAATKPLDGRGSRGRVVASEILVGTPAVANLIATGKSVQLRSMMETGQRFGMQTMEEDLARLIVERKVSESTALAASRSPGLIRDLVATQSSRRAGGVA
jgi:twitching motility protein PilT